MLNIEISVDAHMIMCIPIVCTAQGCQGQGVRMLNIEISVDARMIMRIPSCQGQG